MDARPDFSLDLGRLRREAVPLRVAFLHLPQAGGGPGPLASFVRGRRLLAFDLLLYAHAVAPLSDGMIEASSTAWASAISLPDRPGNRASISRAWSWLESKRLVRTAVAGRNRAVMILNEDGSGRPWAHPAEHSEPYVQVPHEFWTTGFARQLSLPAKAAYLIALSIQPGENGTFELPMQRGAAWYGLTTVSLRSGLRELRSAGILRAWVQQRATPRSPVGRTFDRQYALNPLELAAWRRDNPKDEEPYAGRE
jgi:hypothetical protein